MSTPTSQPQTRVIAPPVGRTDLPPARLLLRLRGRQPGEDGPDEDMRVGLVMSEGTEIGRHPVAGHLEFLVGEMDGVHASSVGRRLFRQQQSGPALGASYRRG